MLVCDTCEYESDVQFAGLVARLNTCPHCGADTLKLGNGR